jgi:hypothetical protein
VFTAATTTYLSASIRPADPIPSMPSGSTGNSSQGRIERWWRRQPGASSAASTSSSSTASIPRGSYPELLHGVPNLPRGGGLFPKCGRSSTRQGGASSRGGSVSNGGV